MNHAAIVDDAERVENLHDDLDDFAQGERPSTTQLVGERRSVDELHRVPEDAVGAAELVDADDVRVVERRGDLRFAGEALDELRILAAHVGQDPERLDSPEPVIGHLPHRREAAATQVRMKHVPRRQHLAHGRGPEIGARTHRRDSGFSAQRAPTRPSLAHCPRRRSRTAASGTSAAHPTGGGVHPAFIRPLHPVRLPRKSPSRSPFRAPARAPVRAREEPRDCPRPLRCPAASSTAAARSLPGVSVRPC